MELMIYSKLKLLLASAIVTVFTVNAGVSTSTAWYKVINVQQISQLIDVNCIDTNNRPCPRNIYWRVYYQATSQYSPVKLFDKTVDINPPQVGAVMQLTVDVASKKMM